MNYKSSCKYQKDFKDFKILLKPLNSFYHIFLAPTGIEHSREELNMKAANNITAVKLRAADSLQTWKYINRSIEAHR